SSQRRCGSRIAQYKTCNAAPRARSASKRALKNEIRYGVGVLVRTTSFRLRPRTLSTSQIGSIRSEYLLICVAHTRTESLPSEGARLQGGGGAHGGEVISIIDRPRQTVRDCLGGPNRHDESMGAVTHDVRSTCVCRSKYRNTARHGLEHDMGDAFRTGRKNKDVAGLNEAN